MDSLRNTLKNKNILVSLKKYSSEDLETGWGVTTHIW